MSASHAVVDTCTGRTVHVGTEDQARNTADLSNGYVGSDTRFTARAVSSPTGAALPAVGDGSGRAETSTATLGECGRGQVPSGAEVGASNHSK